MQKFSGKQLLAPIALLASLAIAEPASAVTVDIYSGYLDTGSDITFSGLAGSFTSPDIQFATNTGYNWHPFGLGVFAADIKSAVDVSAAGSYVFSTNSDDGSYLFIDGSLVVNNGGGHGPATVLSAPIALSAGTHTLEAKFFENFGGASGIDVALPQGVSFGSTPVPVPAAVWLFGSALAGIAGFGRLNNRRAA